MIKNKYEYISREKKWKESEGKNEQANGRNAIREKS